MIKSSIKYIVFIMALCGLSIYIQSNCYAQGFDWQFSARLPHDSPEQFVGLEISSSYLMHKSNLEFIENNCHCTNYGSGTGIGYSASVKYEYWNSGLMAYVAGLGFKFQPGKFISRAEPLPLKNGENYITEYEFQSKNSYIYMDIGAKHRLPGSHFHGGLSLRLMYNIINDSKNVERIIAPADAPPFPTNPPSFERTVSDGKIPDLYSFYIAPIINFGIDLNMGLGLYTTPQIFITFPLMDASKTGTWKKWELSFGVSFYKGI